MKYASAAIVAYVLMGSLGGAQTGHAPARTDIIRKADEMEDSQDTAELLQQYAKQVNRLVKTYKSGLQLISAAVDAGKLSPEQGQALADQGVRFVASRLESFTDMYESLLVPDGSDDMGQAGVQEDGHEADRMLRVNRRLGKQRKTPSSAIANPKESAPQNTELIAF